MIYLQLFLSFCQISVLGFGGGYAILPLIQNAALSHGWLTAADFSNLVTISQMTPGPILINSATFIGCKTGGILGGIVATFGAVFPSTVIVVILSMLYYRYRSLAVIQSSLRVLKPAVMGLIASASLSILLPVLFESGAISWVGLDWIGAGLCAVSFAAIRFLKASPILTIGASGLVGMGLYLLL